MSLTGKLVLLINNVLHILSYGKKIRPQFLQSSSNS